MNIKVLGEGCEKCSQLYENTKEAVKELGIDAEIEKIEDLIEIVKLGVLSAPSLMVYMQYFCKSFLIRFTDVVCPLTRISPSTIREGADKTN